MQQGYEDKLKARVCVKTPPSIIFYSTQLVVVETTTFLVVVNSRPKFFFSIN